MKRKTLTKLLIVSLVFIVVGGMITLGTLASGAKLNLTNLRIGHFNFLKWENWTEHDDNEWNSDHHTDELYSIPTTSSTHTLQLNINIGEVTIQRGNQFAIQTENIPENEITYEEKDGISTLSIHKNDILINSIDDDYQITILVPDTIKVIDANLNCGDFDIENITLTSLRVTCNAGDVDIENIKAETIDLTLDLGDLDFSGDYFNTMNVINHCGDVDIQLARAEAKYNHSCKVNLGSLSINKRRQEGANISSHNNASHALPLSITVDLGDLDIRFAHHEND